MQFDPHRLVQSVILTEHDPVKDSLEVVREKQLGADVVLAVRFEDRQGRQRRGLFGVRCADDRCRPTGSFLGTARDSTGQDIWETSGGWGGGLESGSTAVVGGWIGRSDAVSIRVIDPFGRVQEDRVEGGVAVLMWKGDFDLRGATAELCDSHGQVITSGPVRPVRSPK